MKNKPEKPKLEKYCHFHEDIPASFICNTCGRSICYYCQKNTTFPYQCPECMPEYWSKKVKKERLLCLGPIVIIIALILASVIFSIFLIPDYEYEGYTDIYLENDDIIATLHVDTYNATGNNEIDLTLKIYVTNQGTKESGEIFIELYVMKNGTSRGETKSSTSVVKKEKTAIFYINTTIIVGEYDLQLMIWEDDMVIQKGVKGIRVGSADVAEISAYEIIYEEDEGEKDKGADASGAYFTSFWMPILLIAIPILLLIGWLLYKERTKPPSMPAPPPPGRRKRE